MTLCGVSSQNVVKGKLSFFTLFWLFMLGSVVGFVVEGVWSIIKTGQWEHHGATLWGAFCIIYGVGAVVVYAASYFLKNRSTFIKFCVFIFCGGAVEYFGSLFQQICFGSTSWNYAAHSLNIGGRVSLKMAVIWGVLGILFMHFLYPPIEKAMAKCNTKSTKIVAWVVLVFMVINLCATSLAVWRWNTRLHGAEPANKLEMLIDNTYGNEKMEQLFVNINFLEK